MGELHLPQDLDSLPVMAVLKGSPAWGLLCRLCHPGAPLPGQIVPVSEEEMCSLREDVLIVEANVSRVAEALMAPPARGS